MTALTRRGLLAAGLTLGTAAADAPARGVVVFGDSQADGIASALQRASRHVAGPRVLNRAKPGTALSAPSTFDWPAALHDYVVEPGVGTAVLMFGGNDHWGMRPAPGVLIPLRTDAFRDIYRARAADALAAVLGHGLAVVWVGNPICREPGFSADMQYLNAIFQDVVAATPAVYLDIWTAVADEGGHYARYGRATDGSVVRWRLDDGIHFTPAGYDILAARVNEAISRLLPPA